MSQSKLKKTSELVQQYLKHSLTQMKMLYDRKSQNCVFNPGGKVSVSSPSQKNKMQAIDLGLYLMIKRVGTLYWTFKNCDGRQLTKVCEDGKSILRKRYNIAYYCYLLKHC